MAEGQLADAHNRIQRLSTELVARDAAMRAECEQFQSAAMHAERRAAIEGEHAAANAVRHNPDLGAAWAAGQLVPADAARAELETAERTVNELRRAFEIAKQEQLSESLLAKSLREEGAVVSQSLVAFKAQGAQEILRVREELEETKAARLVDLRRAHEKQKEEENALASMYLRQEKTEAVLQQRLQDAQAAAARHNEGVAFEATAQMRRVVQQSEVSELESMCRSLEGMVHRQSQEMSIARATAEGRVSSFR